MLYILFFLAQGESSSQTYKESRHTDNRVNFSSKS